MVSLSLKPDLIKKGGGGGGGGGGGDGGVASKGFCLNLQLLFSALGMHGWCRLLLTLTY